MARVMGKLGVARYSWVVGIGGCWYYGWSKGYADGEGVGKVEGGET